MDPSLNYPLIFKSLSRDAKTKLGEVNKHDEQATDYACLAKSLAVQECYELAGVFLLGKARCEFSARNAISEASTLFSAAKYFLQADDKYTSMNCINYEDNLNCAIFCLLRSARIYELNELFTLATNVYIYLSDSLMRRCKFHQAICYLKHSIEIISKDILLSLELYKRLSYCQLYLHDWSSSLNTFITIQHLVEKEFKFKHRIRLICIYISGVHLKYFVYYSFYSPSYQLRSLDSSGYSVQQYDVLNCEKGEDLKSVYMDADLFILLQSLVLAHQSKDIVEVESLSVMLQSFVNLEQRELINLIVREMVMDAS
ncbi:F8A1-like protein [Schistosoma japonicum]|nr:F8A1-like protein [Schistosoma japonicum]